MTQPLILQAAFTIETLAHLKGMEKELLPQAEHLRKIHSLGADILGDLDPPYMTEKMEEVLEEIIR